MCGCVVVESWTHIGKRIKTGRELAASGEKAHTHKTSLVIGREDRAWRAFLLGGEEARRMKKRWILTLPLRCTNAQASHV